MAAKGLFSCIFVAAFCNSMHFCRAPSTCALFRDSFGVPVVKISGMLTGGTEDPLFGWEERGNGRAGDLVEATGV
jgi:hypothetical protein